MESNNKYIAGILKHYEVEIALAEKGLAQSRHAADMAKREMETLTKNTTASTLRNRDRPLFSIGSVVVQSKPQAGEPLTVGIAAFNYGSLPAMEATIYGTCSLKTMPLTYFMARRTSLHLPSPHR